MRHPLYMNRLARHEQKKIRRLLARVIAFYFSVALLVIAGAVVKAKLTDAKTDPVRLEAATLK